MVTKEKLGYCISDRGQTLSKMNDEVYSGYLGVPCFPNCL